VRDAADRKGGDAVTAVLAGAGVAAADVVLYAFGGAGALHACGVAERAGVRTVRSFLFGSIFSACGVASGDVRQMVDAVLTDGDDPTETIERLLRRADLDLEAELLDPGVAALELVALSDATESAFAGSREEILAAAAAVPMAERSRWRRLLLTSTVPMPEMPPVDVERFDGGTSRPVHWRDEPEETPLLGVAALTGGATIAGPALLHLAGVVHAIAPGWTVRLEEQSNLVWERA
jgi:N-methylhydantoinase A/oxoprolinase/acetone carboxylase beta subunit